MTYESFLSHFRIEKRKGDRVQAHCTGHEDKHGSLSIALVDSKILVYCHAGCSVDSILNGAGLTTKDLFLNGDRPAESIYQYRNSDNSLAYEKVKYRNTDGSKEFKQRRLDGNQLAYNLDGVKRIPYNYPSLSQAIINNENILYLEGEKDCETARLLGYTATTMGGAGDWKPEYKDYFRKSRLIAVPDKDKPGINLTQTITKDLTGVCQSLKTIILPEGKDFTDWVNTGKNRQDFEILIKTAPELIKLNNIDTIVVYEPLKRPMTDLGNAERLVKLFGSDIRYCFDRKLWLQWVNTHWKWDDGSNIMRLAQKTARSIYGECENEEDNDRREKLAKWAMTSESSMKLSAMITQSEPLVKISLTDLDKNSWLFNCPNGTIDLMTGELKTHNKEDYITMLSPVEFNPDAASDLWQKFLNQIFNDNQDVIAYLQKSLGYTLTGDVTEQSLFFCHGGGQNGKSTLLNVFMEIMQPYAMQADIEMFLTSYKPAAGHSEDIANLAGKRLVIASEIEEGRRLAVAKLKQMTGGERIRASHKHEKEFEFNVNYKIWLNGNHKPDITDTTYSIWRRVKLIPFTVTIPKTEQDKQLLSKLRKEYPAILAWAVKGCLDWQDKGLAEPDDIINAVETYRSEQDLLADFLKAECFINTMDAELNVSHKLLYEAYKNWCEQNSTESVTSRTFAKKLNEKDNIAKFTSSGQRKWRYIRLLHDDEKTKVDKVDKVDDFTENTPHEGKQAEKTGITSPSSTLSLKSSTPTPFLFGDTQNEEIPSTSSTTEILPYPDPDICKNCGANEPVLSIDGENWICSKCQEVYR